MAYGQNVTKIILAKIDCKKNLPCPKTYLCYKIIDKLVKSISIFLIMIKYYKIKIYYNTSTWF